MARGMIIKYPMISMIGARVRAWKLLVVPRAMMI